MPPKKRQKFTHVKKRKSKSHLTPEASSSTSSLRDEGSLEEPHILDHSEEPDLLDPLMLDHSEEPHSLKLSECLSIGSELNVGPDKDVQSCSPSDDFNVPREDDTEAVNLDLLKEACTNIQAFLPKSWLCRVHDGGIDAMLLSHKGQVAIQRTLHFTPCGNVTLSVHCQPVNISDFLKGGTNSAPLTQDTLSVFVDHCVKIVEELRAYEICAGLDDLEYRDVWSSVSFAKIDSNPYQESRYKETLRSNSCNRLVLVRRWRCKQCEHMKTKFLPLFRRHLSKTNFKLSINK